MKPHDLVQCSKRSRDQNHKPVPEPPDFLAAAVSPGYICGTEPPSHTPPYPQHRQTELELHTLVSDSYLHLLRRRKVISTSPPPLDDQQHAKGARGTCTGRSCRAHARSSGVAVHLLCASAGCHSAWPAAPPPGTNPTNHDDYLPPNGPQDRRPTTPDLLETSFQNVVIIQIFIGPGRPTWPAAAA